MRVHRVGSLTRLAPMRRAPVRTCNPRPRQRRRGTSTSPPFHSSVDAEQLRRFDAYSGSWWSAGGPASLLARMNPCRVSFIRRCIERYGIRPSSATTPLDTPLAGVRVLDVGCGGGLVSEPLARLGAQVTGLDASAEAIAVARARQEQLRQLVANAEGAEVSVSATVRRQLQPLQYRVGTLESYLEGDSMASSADRAPAPTPPAPVDVLTALEIVEHVTAPRAFLQNAARALRPGGLLILSTIDRSAAAYVGGILVAEYVLGVVPRGTHDWRRFIQPEEMCEALLSLHCAETDAEDASGTAPSAPRMEVLEMAGLVPDWRTGAFRLSANTSVNYILAARRVNDFD
ncbi:hypothetical protein CDCA_CDCA01G0344 [Cyanidium caldarium]|uniref:Ubiquinone biosynthesis O-methyltransferase, mitochondrial n=1 Tax=Cyanidium caldarium TaxID=2771 RepID=A0AAV9IQB2_CYACA|nr:hypothetical protein CDCA_CDCA01G0344 [Cyanidium caldarium]